MTHQQRIRQRMLMGLFMLVVIVPHPLRAQVTTEVVWQRCIGGSGLDWGTHLTGTSDGGFVAIGWSASTDGDATDNHGGNDILVTRLDANGGMLWRRSFGGSSEDYAYSCIEASDGSIMIAGHTYSTDGDVTQNQGDSDLWVFRLSPLGAIIWQRTYGGSGAEGGGEIQEVADGGFVIHGFTGSSDGDVVDLHPGGGSQDHWVVKIDASGALEWNRALGGSSMDVGTELIHTTNGGFLMNFSYTSSNDGDVTGNHGTEDCWLVKLSAAGSIEWSLTIGGSQREFGSDVRELANGDFMLLGNTTSDDGDIVLTQGGSDVLLAKISGSGSLLWTRTYGGTGADDCRSMAPTGDGGFVLAGSSNSVDGDVTSNLGERDVWALKVDANGAIIWQRSFGGTMDEWAFMEKGDLGGYVLTGITYSNDGAIMGGHGDRELWLAKLDDAGDLAWQRCLGGSAEDWGYMQAQTAGSGFVAYGYTDSNDGDVSGNHGGRDIWVVKLNVTEPTVPPECALYVPNAFSPNTSGKNDQHCVYGTECVTSMTFNIYDRWGNKVFQSTGPEACWDGQYKGQLLDPAVFVYYLRATLRGGDTVERQGNLTLVR